MALAAVRNQETVAEPADRFGVHPAMINNQKRALVECAPDISDKV